MPNWHNTEAAAMTLIARGNQSCANKRRNLYALLCPPKGREGSGQIGKAEAEHDAVESDTLTADTGQEQTTLASLFENLAHHGKQAKTTRTSCPRKNNLPEETIVQLEAMEHELAYEAKKIETPRSRSSNIRLPTIKAGSCPTHSKFIPSRPRIQLTKREQFMMAWTAGF